MKNDTLLSDNPGVIAAPLLIYGGALVLGLLLHLAFPMKLKLLMFSV